MALSSFGQGVKKCTTNKVDPICINSLEVTVLNITANAVKATVSIIIEYPF